MQSIHGDEENSLADAHWHPVDGYSAPQTPSTLSDHPAGEADAGPQRYASDEDEEYGGSSQVGPKRKRGGYDSRIEQILYENPDLPILIVDAGKSSESGGKYIVYTIRTGVSSCISCIGMADFGRILRCDDVTRNLLH
jgi:hypothetical protein